MPEPQDFDAVLVDFSWLLARSHFAMSKRADLSAVVDGAVVPTGDIYGTLSSLSGICRAAPSAKVVLCVDSKVGGVYESKAHFDGYKADRDFGPRGNPAFDKYGETLAAASLLERVFVAERKGSEADELMVTLAGHLSDSGKRVLIFARDKDMCQAVRGDLVFKSDKVSGGKFVDVQGEAEVAARFGCSPEAVRMFQAITGDGIDGFDGFARFQRKHAAAIAEAFRSPEDLWSRDRGALGPSVERQAAKLDADREKLERNFRLADMRLAGDLDGIEFSKVGGGRAVVDKYRLSKFREEVCGPSGWM